MPACLSRLVSQMVTQRGGPPPPLPRPCRETELSSRKPGRQRWGSHCRTAHPFQEWAQESTGQQGQGKGPPPGHQWQKQEASCFKNIAAEKRPIRTGHAQLPGPQFSPTPPLTPPPTSLLQSRLFLANGTSSSFQQRVLEILQSKAQSCGQEP